MMDWRITLRFWWIINHQLEVYRASSILTIVFDVSGPGFAFDVYQDARLKIVDDK